MAQYNKNFYGASFYGDINVLSGQYASNWIPLSDDPISGTLNVTINAELPVASYDYQHVVMRDEFNGSVIPTVTEVINGDTYIKLSGTHVAEFRVTCRKAEIVYLKGPGYGSLAVNGYNELDEYVNDWTVNCNYATIEEASGVSGFCWPTLHDYTYYLCASSGTVYIRCINAHVTDVQVQMVVSDTASDLSKTSFETLSNGEWELVSGSKYTRAMEVSPFSDCIVYAFKIIMSTSDDTLAPSVSDIMFQTNDTNVYASKATWVADITLSNPSSIDNVYCSKESIEGTAVHIYTRSYNGTAWSAWSPVYNCGKYIGLANDQLTETIYTPVLDPSSTNVSAVIRRLVVGQYAPAGTRITYKLINQDLGNIRNYYAFMAATDPSNDTYTVTDALTSVSGSKVLYNDVFINTMGMDLNSISSPVRVAITLKRDNLTSPTPIFRFATIEADATYEERFFVSPCDTMADGTPNTTKRYAYASAVYNRLGGNVPAAFVLDEADYEDILIGNATYITPENMNFSPPTKVEGLAVNTTSTISTPTYIIEPEYVLYRVVDGTETKVPLNKNELAVFWESGESTRSLTTTLPNDVLIAQVTPYDPTGTANIDEYNIFLAYQYGYGVVVYGSDKTIEPGNTFVVPRLKGRQPILDGVKYAYYLVNGSANASGIENTNEQVAIAWGGTQYQEPYADIVEDSIHNGTTNRAITIASTNPDRYGRIEWISEAKRFSSIIINENDDSVATPARVFLRSVGDFPTVAPQANLDKYIVVAEPGSVMCRGKIVPDSRIHAELTITGYTPVDMDNEPIIRTAGSAHDTLSREAISGTARVVNSEGVTLMPTISGSDIDWSGVFPEGTPEDGEIYYVSYQYNTPSEGIITARAVDSKGHDYYENKVRTHAWSSAKLYHSQGICAPREDYVSATLPAISESGIWGTIDTKVENIEYYVLDNNPWVTTFIKDSKVVGTLRNRKPSQQWLPSIHNGYYYLNKDEYYKFSQPAEYTPEVTKLEQATNAVITSTGTLLEPATTNLVTDPTFNISEGTYTKVYELRGSDPASCQMALLHGAYTVNEAGIIEANEATMAATVVPFHNMQTRMEYIYNGDSVSLVFCYNEDIGYLEAKITPYNLTLQRVQIVPDYGERVIATLGTADIVEEPQFTIDSRYSITVTKTDTVLVVEATTDGTSITLTAEDNLYQYGGVGFKCENSIRLDNIQVLECLGAWEPTPNDSSGPSVDLYNNTIYITSIDQAHGIGQTVTTEAGYAYTLSFDYTGNSAVIGIDDDYTSDTNDTGTVKRVSRTFIASEEAHRIFIGSSGEQTIAVANVQVEQHPYATQFTPSARGEGSITIPSSSISPIVGTLYISYTPLTEITEEINIISLTGSEMSIKTDGNTVTFYYGETSTSVNIPIETGNEVQIAASWNASDNEFEMQLIKLMVCIEGSVASNYATVSSNDHISIAEDSILMIGAQESIPAIYKNLRIYDYIFGDSFGVPDDYVYAAALQGVITTYDNSYIEISPAPVNGQPILVYDEDGPYTHIAFVDNNKLVPYTTEMHTWRGEPISLHYVVDPSFVIVIKDEKGVPLLNSDEGKIIISGNTLTLDVAEEEIEERSEDELYEGNIWITYRPAKCFTSEFFDDKCVIRLTGFCGKPVTIVYESNPYDYEHALIDTADLNPMNNPNNFGFIRIHQRTDVATSFDVKVTPETLRANGHEFTVIIIDAKDGVGNPVSNVNYTFSGLRYGTLERYITDEQAEFIARRDNAEDQASFRSENGYLITLNEMAGRQIFIYTPRRHTNLDPTYGTVEEINLLDTESGLGMAIDIRLMPA